MMTKHELYDFILEQPNGNLHPKRIARVAPNLINDINTHPGVTWTERLYNYMNDDPEHFCPVCGNITNFGSYFKGYKQFCCSKCSSIGTREKTKQICLERYGVENPFQSESVKIKSQKTMMERYGAKHSTQSSIIKKRIIKSNREKFGTDWAIGNKDVRKRAQTTIQKRYGVKSYTASTEMQIKSRRTKMNRYGDENYTNASQISKTWRQKTPAEIKEIRDKQHKTNLLKYGNPFYLGHTNESHGEIDLRNELQSIFPKTIKGGKILYGVSSTGYPCELDILIKDKNVGIEYNGIWTHWNMDPFRKDATVSSHISKEDYYKSYHKKKMIAAATLGIDLLMVWEPDYLKDKMAIINLIKEYVETSNRSHPKFNILKKLSPYG